MLIEKRFESSGLLRILSKLYPNTQFSYATLLLFDKISHLNFLLFDGNGAKSTEMDKEHPEYITAKSSLDMYMGEIYGKLNELYNEVTHQ